MRLVSELNVDGKPLYYVRDDADAPRLRCDFELSHEEWMRAESMLLEFEALVWNRARCDSEAGNGAA